MKGEFALVGNSIGSLISVTMASREQKDSSLKGVYLINCAGGMNVTHILDDPPTTLFGWGLLIFTNLQKLDIVNNVLFDKIKDPENVKETLMKIYVNKDRVDKELVDSIVNPSSDEGANKVF